MKVDTFESLLVDLSREVDVDAAQLLEDGRLVVDETEVALALEPAADGEHLWICVDFGAVPEAKAHRVYRAMLDANLRAGGLEVGVFTLQVSGRAALLVRRPLSAALTGERLAQALLQYAAAAKCWIANASGANGHLV
jgi:hypothetical protein